MALEKANIVNWDMSFMIVQKNAIYLFQDNMKKLTVRLRNHLCIMAGSRTDTRGRDHGLGCQEGFSFIYSYIRFNNGYSFRVLVSVEIRIRVRIGFCSTVYLASN